MNLVRRNLRLERVLPTVPRAHCRHRQALLDKTKQFLPTASGRPPQRRVRCAGRGAGADRSVADVTIPPWKILRPFPGPILTHRSVRGTRGFDYCGPMRTEPGGR